LVNIIAHTVFRTKSKLVFFYLEPFSSRYFCFGMFYVVVLVVLILLKCVLAVKKLIVLILSFASSSEYKVNIGFILRSFLSNKSSWLMKIFTCVSTIKISYMDKFYFPLHRKFFDSRFFVESHIACLLRLCVCSDMSL